MPKPKNEETVGDVLATLTTKQRKCVEALIGQAILQAEEEGFQKGFRAKSRGVTSNKNLKTLSVKDL